MSRPNLEEIYGRLEILKRAWSTLYRDDLEDLLPYIAELEEEVDNLKEAAVPRTLEGDGSDLPFGSVVIDCDGDAWQRDWDDGWSLAGGSSENAPVLRPGFAPYTIIYTTEENANE